MNSKTEQGQFQENWRDMIKRAEKELFREVKEYLEKNPSFSKKCASVEDLKYFVDCTKIKQEIEVKGTKIQLCFFVEGSHWAYLITCEEFGIHKIRPTETEEFTAQVKLTFNFRCENNTGSILERKVYLRF